MSPRREDFAEGRLPKGFFIARESYERLLRRLVLGYSKRIRWKVATATSLRISPEDCRKVNAIKVRTPDGVECEQEAALVIGAYEMRPFGSLLNTVFQIVPGRLRLATGGCSKLQKVPTTQRHYDPALHLTPFLGKI